MKIRWLIAMLWLNEDFRYYLRKNEDILSNRSLQIIKIWFICIYNIYLPYFFTFMSFRSVPGSQNVETFALETCQPMTSSEYTPSQSLAVSDRPSFLRLHANSLGLPCTMPWSFYLNTVWRGSCHTAILYTEIKLILSDVAHILL